MNLDKIDQLFNDMKILNTPVKHNTVDCKEELNKYLDKNSSRYKYIVRTYSNNLKHKFHKQLQIYKHLNECNVTPRVYKSFECGNYNMMVLDRWHGDLSHYLNQATLETVKQDLYDLLKRLHSCGYVYSGKFDVHSFIYIIRNGKIDWLLHRVEKIRKLQHPMLKDYDFKNLELFLEQLGK